MPWRQMRGLGMLITSAMGNTAACSWLQAGASNSRLTCTGRGRCEVTEDWACS